MYENEREHVCKILCDNDERIFVHVAVSKIEFERAGFVLSRFKNENGFGVGMKLVDTVGKLAKRIVSSSRAYTTEIMTNIRHILQYFIRS